MNAQERTFYQIKLNHTFHDTLNWTHSWGANWKQLDLDNGWNRIGGNASTKRHFGIWSIGGGLLGNFTYDPSIENFTEIRPHISLGLKSPLSPNMQFSQEVRFEWRNLFYDGALPDEHNTRVRYLISPSYVFLNEEKEENWILTLEYEWYLLSTHDHPERFVNSSEFKCILTKVFRDRYELELGFVIEKFNSDFNLEEEEEGHTFFCAFSF